LAQGAIYWDAGGNLLPNSTNAVYTVNFAIPNTPLAYSATSQYPVGSYCTYSGTVYKCTTAIAAGGESWTSGHWTSSSVISPNGLALASGTPYCNYGTLASIIGGVAGMSAVDTTLWSTLDGTTKKGTANLQQQMIALQQIARARTGYKLECAFYGSSILGWFNNNQMVQQVLTGSARYADAAMVTEIPDGTLGIKKWYPVADAFFASSTLPLGSDETANVNFWFPPNQITFTPAFNPEWWEVVEGTYPVPAAFNITKDMMGQLQALKQIAGPYSYATLQDDPPSVKHLAGTTELPVVKVPGSVFQVQVG
jgi:hypothetical protein